MGNDGKNAAGCEACSTGCPRNRAGGLPGRCGGGAFEGTGVHRVCLSRAGPAAWGIPCPGKLGSGRPCRGDPPAPRQKGAHRPCGRSRAALSRRGCPDGQATRMRTLPKMRAIPTAADRDNGSWRKKIPRQAAERGSARLRVEAVAAGVTLSPARVRERRWPWSRPRDAGPRARPRASPATPPGRSRRRAAYTARSGGTGPS